MIPIIYESTETEFTSNGLGRLRDCISCEVTEERNGIYELEFQYPVTGSNYDLIRLGRIVAVEHDSGTDVQPFDIVSYERPIDGIVTFKGVHISYRQSLMVASGKNISSLNASFEMLKGAVPSNPFVYSSDFSSSSYLAAGDGIPRSVRSLLGGVEGSILDSYGGEYEWDKWNVILWRNRGVERDFTIRYGVNLVDFNEETSYSGSYSAVVPYWSGAGEGIVVKGGMVDSNLPTYTGRTDCIPLDLTDKFQNQPTVQDLEETAASYMIRRQTNLPQQTISVDFIRLQDTPNYEEYASLFECKLCDTIRVVFPRYNIDGKFKIVKTVYDVLQERYTEMELGTLSVSLAEALGVSSGSESERAGIVVEEQGQSGIWRYRKWSNGFCELWGKATITGAFTQHSSGSYRMTGSVTLPFTVTDIAATASHSGNSSTYYSYVANVYSPDGTTINVALDRISAASNATSVVSIFVAGRWQ